MMNIIPTSTANFSNTNRLEYVIPRGGLRNLDDNSIPKPDQFAFTRRLDNKHRQQEPYNVKKRRIEERKKHLSENNYSLETVFRRNSIAKNYQKNMWVHTQFMEGRHESAAGST